MQHLYHYGHQRPHRMLQERAKKQDVGRDHRHIWTRLPCLASDLYPTSFPNGIPVQIHHPCLMIFHYYNIPIHIQVNKQFEFLSKSLVLLVNLSNVTNKLAENCLYKHLKLKLDKLINIKWYTSLTYWIFRRGDHSICHQSPAKQDVLFSNLTVAPLIKFHMQWKHLINNLMRKVKLYPNIISNSNTC